MNKQYKDKFGYIHELPTNENEVKKLNNMMNDTYYLANMQKPQPSKYGDIPSNFITEYENRRRKNSEENK
jgi:hypothetical protein